ncbi:MAG: hypothetical protein RI911_966 [Candidatus Parcubacteria bacterium]|jgi:16S rRNA (uracil1498-N3)-methyltransferase
MKIHRFFIHDEPASETYVIQDDALVHQISRVLRIERGERVALVIGNGAQWLAEIQEIEKKFVTVKLIEKQTVWIPKKQIVVCLSVIRKERFEWALEKCTEVGVSAIVPLMASRSERGVVSEERAHRIMQEAAEQCGRGNIPELGTAVALSDLLTEVRGECIVACDMGGGPLADVPHLKTTDTVYLCIGPEGGWTNEERNLLQAAGAAFVSLGHTVLRAETAAVAACVLAQHELE